MNCMQLYAQDYRIWRVKVSIPQAVWIACNEKEHLWSVRPVVSIPQAVWIACNDMTSVRAGESKLFQYRKRYELHAMLIGFLAAATFACFNTASGMNCMQFIIFQPNMYPVPVSIPQAVWIACNALVLHKKQCPLSFQYRKRYELHAIEAELHRANFTGAFQYRKRYELHAMPK